MDHNKSRQEHNVILACHPDNRLYLKVLSGMDKRLQRASRPKVQKTLKPQSPSFMSGIKNGICRLFGRQGRIRQKV